jgi:hypothetical protein
VTMTIEERKHPLLYTKAGDLDFGWVILIACCVVGLSVFVLDAFGAIRGPSIAGWSWFGAFTSMAFISGVAISRARLIAKSDVPGDVAKGVASSAPTKFDKHTWKKGDPDEGVI